MRVSAYCTLAVTVLSGSSVGAQPQGSETASTFNVFLNSTPIGFEQLELTRNSNGWIIRSHGDLSQPIDLQNQLFQIDYDAQWRPRALAMDGVRANSAFSIRTTFGADGATSQVEEAGQQRRVTAAVPPDAVVLPDYFFGAYAALAFRLAGAEVGEEIPVYVAPRGGALIRVDQVLSQQIDTGQAVVDAMVHRVSFLTASAPLAVEVWTDAEQRLLRVAIPGAGLDVAREDVVSSRSRLRQTSHAGDEDLQVPAAGFSLAVTVTTPVDQPRPASGWPTVLLVPGAGAGDRDGAQSGVPVLGQMAGALADAGFLVARYDRRGVGQSGGRPESAGIDVYADDARTIIRYLDDRDDVDDDRITVLGYAEGGWIAMVAVSREGRADALVLVSTPGTTGAELVMEQQRAALDQLGAAETERTAKIALQQRIHDAVLGNGSWDGVADDMRRQADTLAFRSFLEFDPADVVRRIRQPILLLQGSLDAQTDLRHAARLETLARARSRSAVTERLTLEGLDQLLMAAGPDAVAEYGNLSDRSISPAFIEALTDWLQRVP